jgi:glycosyltransferase involved in cell wall biosynthesis
VQDRPHSTTTTEPAPLRRSPRLLSVVIPVLNEERGLQRLIDRVKPVLESLDLSWELIFIDDGSKDRTRALLHAAHEADARIKTVALSRNFGKEIAVAAGLSYARGDGVILMDGDLQHPPEIIPEFVARWREGYDIVYGQRDDRVTDSALRRAAARSFYNLFYFMSGTTLPDGAGDFRLLDRKAVDAMNRLKEHARFNKGLYAWIGFKSVGVTFHVPPRADGEPSRWRPRQLWRFALDGLVSFSTMPLRIWSYIGIAVSGFAFTYIAAFLMKTLIYGRDANAPGFPTLIVAVLLLGGVQLISLGVIGEYLGRMYEEVKGRPLFIVTEEIGLQQPRADMEPRRDG